MFANFDNVFRNFANVFSKFDNVLSHFNIVFSNFENAFSIFDNVLKKLLSPVARYDCVPYLHVPFIVQSLSHNPVYILMYPKFLNGFM